MKTLIAIAALAITASALGAAPRSATLTIRHQMKGCHSWSADGKHWSPTQNITLTVGGTLIVKNNDVMPQTLIQVKGPRARVKHAAMTHMGAAGLVRFPARGTYVFTTKAGADYTKGVKTVGEDNTLRLVVKVT